MGSAIEQNARRIGGVGSDAPLTADSFERAASVMPQVFSRYEALVLKNETQAQPGAGGPRQALSI